MDYVWLYYFPIHTRAAPWLIGMTLGYLIFESKEGRLRIVKSKVTNLILFYFHVLVLVINFLIVILILANPSGFMD